MSDLKKIQKNTKKMLHVKKNAVSLHRQNRMVLNGSLR